MSVSVSRAALITGLLHVTLDSLGRPKTKTKVEVKGGRKPKAEVQNNRVRDFE